MKTKTFVVILFLITSLSTAFAYNTIEGNRNIVTQSISITDYDEVSMAGSMEFVYEQSGAEPYLEITVDENILPYLQAEVKGRKLIVGVKTDENGGRRNSYNIQPTVYKIKSNSRELKKVNSAGSGKFIVTSSLSGNDLEVSKAGSGSIIFNEAVKATNIKLNLAGSGKIKADDDITSDQINVSLAGSGTIELKQNIKGDDLKLSVAGSGKMLVHNIDARKADCSLSSSGEMKVNGKTEEVTYSVAGSGRIKAFDCSAKEVKSSLSGSGRIELSAAEQLEASIVGSGNISYKGNPSIVKSTMGSGSVKQVN